MLNRRPSPRRLAGFTLLELLVVVILIGIVVSVVTVSATTGNLEDQLEEEAKRMQALMSLAREEAILRNQELAFSVTRDSYRFEVLEEGNWKPITGDRIFREREIAGGLEMSLLVDEVELSLSAQQEETLASRIYFLSSGEITPFELVLRSVNERYERRVTLNEDDELVITQPEDVY